ncbi:MAG: hypothetical protein M1814_002141 [Vezdaea aestivalis]|nr:MAG: hypothetical protein M1814_002141 [Vezdaea aestivalis]
MASDTSYAAFLDKANSNPGSSTAKAQSTKKGTKAVNASVPASLEDVGTLVYTSDADEPFEAVSLKFDEEKLPDANAFKTLLLSTGSNDTSSVDNDSDPEEVDLEQWNGKGHYDKVVKAVEAETEGQVKVFRVSLGGVRAEYFVVGLDSKRGRIVGLKALAVES